jgi:hypothetical protein
MAADLRSCLPARSEEVDLGGGHPTGMSRQWQSHPRRVGNGGAAPWHFFLMAALVGRC